MINKLPHILVTLLVLAAGFYLLVSHVRHGSIICPDDYADTDAGSTAYITDTNKWTNDFFDAHPDATLADWSAARHQFWIDNNCAAALERYDEAKRAQDY